jgi:uncharacterized glyoxalase superfamily protein PhnB
MRQRAIAIGYLGGMVIPTLHYDDAHAAIDFLEQAFGFERHAVHEGKGGRIEHAELRAQNGWIMLGSRRSDSPYDTGHSSAYVVVEDVDGHCERAKAAGADVFREPEDQDYGGRDYSCRDPEGNVWSFGTYAPTE